MGIGSLSAPLSAFSAYGFGTQVAAHNLANVLTNNFQAGRVVYSETGHLSGVRANVTKPNGGQIENSQLERPSNTDVATEMVNLIVNSRVYQANAKTVSTIDDMLGMVINLKV